MADRAHLPLSDPPSQRHMRWHDRKVIDMEENQITNLPFEGDEQEQYLRSNYDTGVQGDDQAGKFQPQSGQKKLTGTERNWTGRGHTTGTMGAVLSEAEAELAEVEGIQDTTGTGVSDRNTRAT
jgi:hypothetical protein